MLKNAATVHVRCRGEMYPRGKNIKRVQVKDEDVPWKASVKYEPTVFTDDKILNSKVTDVDLLINKVDKINFNQIDGKIDRRSFTGEYEIKDGLPLNPRGRTGIKGRGCLYYWGPNHAADPVVTTWKCDSSGNKVLHETSKKPILKFVAIYRKHDHEWALPGGMVDPGENVSKTIQREFSEEALNCLLKSKDELKKVKSKIDKLFENGTVIYEGYVDDPRNTDNAWMETVAMNFHDSDGSGFAKLPLEAGDDAEAVKWIELDSSLHLYASHSDILKKLVDIHGCHW